MGRWVNTICFMLKQLLCEFVYDAQRFISASCSTDFLILFTICTNNLSVFVIVSTETLLDFFNVRYIFFLKELYIFCFI